MSRNVARQSMHKTYLPRLAVLLFALAIPVFGQAEFWQDHDKKRNPSRVSISGSTSRWNAVHGISLGTSYSDLKRLNGRSFPISWGTDQGNVVLSWKGGLLEQDLKGEGQVFIWFDDVPSDDGDRASTVGQEKRERRINQIA